MNLISSHFEPDLREGHVIEKIDPYQQTQNTQGDPFPILLTHPFAKSNPVKTSKIKGLISINSIEPILVTLPSLHKPNSKSPWQPL
jgi:hypothetical protein